MSSNAFLGLTVTQLQRRLEESWDAIEAARRRGDNIRMLEEHWLRLLAEYERRCQQETYD